MKRALPLVVLLVLLSVCSAWRVLAQSTYTVPADQVVPGRPWTNFIPDPDQFDWSQAGPRPGYLYRGMLPMQQRFYDYIQQKRRTNTPLNDAEQATIRWLISSRRWPEPPRPNAFWAAFMRYMRQQRSLDLNLAQTLMMDQLIQRGLVPVDPPPARDFDRVRNYLNSGPFRSRNWFERWFGRVEPWMDNLYAGWGLDMRPPGASTGGNAFPPGDPFNGLKITYDVSGATIGKVTDSGSFTIQRSITGVLGTGTLAISGVVRVGGFGADVSLSVWAGDQKADKKFYIENRGSDGSPQTFNLSVPIPAAARTGGFAIRLDGRYSMGGGHRGCYVVGDFGPSKEQIDADRAAADAKWKQEVEDTMARLGVSESPEGRELAEMRKALAGGNDAWQAYVNDRLDQMRGDTSPQQRDYDALQNAMANGGPDWDRYVATHGGGTTPSSPPTPPADPTSTGGSRDASAAAAAVKQGRDAYEQSKYAEAIAAFTRAIEADPNSADGYAGRGLARHGLSDTAGATADIDRALELDANSADAYRGRSMLRRAKNDFPGALADANRCVDLAPAYYRGYLTRGLVRERLSDPAGAQADYNRALELNPRYTMSYFYRGSVRLTLKDNRGALDDLNRFLDSNASHSGGFNNRGLAKERLGDIDGAIADFENALFLDKTNAAAQRNLDRVKNKRPAGQV